MSMTIWFFVMLFAVGDHVTLSPYYPPVETRGLQECMDLGVSLMIDKNNPNVSIHCIEADDWLDLSNTMRKNFTFGGQGI